MKMRYRYTNNKSIQAKISAWVELFGVDNPPTLTLSGVWCDMAGDLVFFDTANSSPVETIGRKAIGVKVDGTVQDVIGTADSWYVLS